MKKRIFSKCQKSKIFERPQNLKNFGNSEKKVFQVIGKRSFPKKAQGAMEFLMVHGWAILVVLVVIGALAYSVVLNPYRFLPESCIMSTGSRFVCEDSLVTETGALLKIQSFHNSITILDASITNKETGVSCDIQTNQFLDLEGIQSGNIISLPLNARDFLGNPCDLAIEDMRFKGDISINYTDGTFQRTARGDIVSTVVDLPCGFPNTHCDGADLNNDTFINNLDLLTARNAGAGPAEIGRIVFYIPCWGCNAVGQK